MVDRTILTQLRTELAQTEMREQRLRAMIREMESLMGEPGGRMLPADPDNPKPYRGMTYGDAAYDVLVKVGKPMLTRDLAEALLEGGVETKARNFVATLYSLMYKDGRFEMENRHWDIKEGEKPGKKKRG